MSGYAVSSFVDGFFKGRGLRDDKEDRKLDRERQERLDKMDAQTHSARMEDRTLNRARQAKLDAMNAQTHNANMENHGFEKAERVRAEQRRSEEEAYMRKMAGAMGATPESMPDATQQFPLGTDVNDAEVSEPRQTPPQPRLGYGVDRPQAEPQRLELESGGSDDALAGGLSITPSGYEDRLNSGVREVDPKASGFKQDVQGLQRANQISQSLSQITTKLATSGGASPLTRTFGAVRDYFSETPEGAQDNKQQRQANAAALKWFQSKDALDHFTRNPDQLQAAAQDPVGFIQGMSQAQDAPPQPQPEAQPQATPPQPQPEQAVPGAPTDLVPPKVQEAETVAGEPVQKRAAAASIDTAQRVALSFGLRPGEKFNDSQVSRGSKAYVDRYYETVAPKIAEFYIGRGEMGKAQAYIDLIESRNGKQALQDIGKATFSVVNGDYDSAANHMLSALKRYDYVDASMDVDEEATGIVKDGSGNPVGGKVVFVDKKSGNRYEKTFATPDEFIEYGHLMTSPSTVAELLFQKKPQPKGAIGEKEILDAAVEIQKADLSGETTLDQAMQQVMNSLGSLGASASRGPARDVPLYRPGG